jgi:uncharacterized protein YecE (DUF72 family)
VKPGLPLNESLASGLEAEPRGWVVAAIAARMIRQSRAKVPEPPILQWACSDVHDLLDAVACRQSVVARVHIGTCGWMYKNWRELFYEDLPPRTWLGQIDEKFGCVEIDAAFYRQQKAETFAKWASQVSPQFSFALRGHRYITHNRKLKDVRESVLRVKEPAMGLGKKLSAVLWQTPPAFKKNLDRLKSFAEELEEWRDVWHVMEFRHESWFDAETAKAMEACKLVNCISDAGKFKRWDAVTAGAVYVRLHGKPRTYVDSYSSRQLGNWAKKICSWRKQGKEVYVFFDNDVEVAAPRNAASLKQMVESSNR